MSLYIIVMELHYLSGVFNHFATHPCGDSNFVKKIIMGWH